LGLIYIFTYKSKKTIIKVLKQANINIASKTSNSVEKVTSTKPKMDIYDNSGICQLKCHTCPSKYTGQTGRTFYMRYTEYIQDIKNNKGKNGFSCDILNTGHNYIKVEDTMRILKQKRKAKHMNSLENYYI
jgi:hypothetical protein